MKRVFAIFALVVTTAAGNCWAQDFRVPNSATAGEDLSIATSGNGKGTFYLVGPGASIKTEVALGEAIHLKSGDLRIAGGYLAILCSETCKSTNFYVNAAAPATIAFLVHPSRVPVGRNDAVSGVALPFDRFHNLVLAPKNVNFQLVSKNAAPFSHAARTQDGIAWFRTASGKAAGAVEAHASLDDVTAKRAVQQVASEPCNLRINGQRTNGGIIVQTDPVRDCAGNVVPDGTIITFTASEANGKDTVDAPIKQGVARVKMEAKGATVVSAASGVVMGNDLRIEAQR